MEARIGIVDKCKPCDQVAETVSVGSFINHHWSNSQMALVASLRADGMLRLSPAYHSTGYVKYNQRVHVFRSDSMRIFFLFLRS